MKKTLFVLILGVNAVNAGSSPFSIQDLTPGVGPHVSGKRAVQFRLGSEAKQDVAENTPKDDPDVTYYCWDCLKCFPRDKKKRNSIKSVSSVVSTQFRHSFQISHSRISLPDSPTHSHVEGMPVAEQLADLPLDIMVHTDLGVMPFASSPDILTNAWHAEVIDPPAAVSTLDPTLTTEPWPAEIVFHAG